MLGRGQQNLPGTMYTPEGDIVQVNYGQEAVRKGSNIIGLKGKDFVLLAGELKKEHLIEAREKIHFIDEHIGMTTAGLVIDSDTIIGTARAISMNYRFKYDEPIPVKTLTKDLARNIGYRTQFAGMRVLGSAEIIGGISTYTDGKDLELCHIDPSGATFFGDAFASGMNSAEIIQYLTSHYRREITEKQAVELVVAAINSPEDISGRTHRDFGFGMAKQSEGIFKRLEQKDLETILNG